MPEVHDMHLQGVMEFGVGEWSCGVCTHRVLIRTAPFEKLVLETGNKKANHVYMVGDKRIVSVSVTGTFQETQEDLDWLTGHGMMWSG